MSALPAEVYQIAADLGVSVYRVGRDIITHWNEARGQNEYRHFAGWYWSLSDKVTRGTEIKRGPFPCPSAAYREAREYLEDHATTNPRIARVIRKNMQAAREARA